MKLAVKLIILSFILLRFNTVFGYVEYNYDLTNTPTLSHSSCIMILSTNTGSPPNVTGHNFPFSGTGYISNSGGISCTGGAIPTYSSLGNPPDGFYIIEWGENSLFPFTADYWSQLTIIGGKIVAYKNPFFGTEFRTTTPLDNDILTGSNVTIGATWFISSDDIEKLTTAFSGPSEKIRVTAQITDLMDSTWSYKVIDYVLPTGFEDSTSTLISFDGVTRNKLVNNHDYAINYQITGSNYYNIFGPIFTVSTTTYFTVGSTTNSGNLRNYVASTTQAKLAYLASGYSLNACNPFSGDWNIVDCILSLIKPDSYRFNRTLSELKDGFATRQPIGYVTRFISILSNNATSSLPSYTIQFDPSGPLASSTLTFNPQDMLDGGGNLLDSIQDPIHHMNFRDVFGNLIKMLVAFAVLFTIISDITKSHNHNQQNNRSNV